TCLDKQMNNKLKHLLAVPIIALSGVPLAAQVAQDPAVMRALVDEALSIRQGLDRREAAWKAGIEVEPVQSHEEQSERLADVLGMLARYQTPEVIPALAAFIETGGLAQNALADFGE